MRRPDQQRFSEAVVSWSFIIIVAIVVATCTARGLFP